MVTDLTPARQMFFAVSKKEEDRLARAPYFLRKSRDQRTNLDAQAAHPYDEDIADSHALHGIMPKNIELPAIKAFVDMVLINLHVARRCLHLVRSSFSSLSSSSTSSPRW